MTDDECDSETVTFELLKINHEKLWTVAAQQRENFTEVLNRSVALYELLHSAPAGNIVTWRDADGNERRVLVLADATPVSVSRSRISFALLLFGFALMTTSAFFVAAQTWFVIPFLLGGAMLVAGLVLAFP